MQILSVELSEKRDMYVIVSAPEGAVLVQGNLLEPAGMEFRLDGVGYFSTLET